tara:strand:+ start:226 stop:498 length:273 start_codon:yes stop_codon:yes gene_type:complete
MKKILIFIILINTLTLNSFSGEIKDCSKYSKLSTEYYKCKSDNLFKDAKKYTDNFISDTKYYQDKEWSEEKSKLKDAKNKLKDVKKKVLD